MEYEYVIQYNSVKIIGTKNSYLKQWLFKKDL